MNTIRKMIRDTKGATAIEYGLIAALIAVAGVAAFDTLGGQISKTVNNAASKMKAGEASN